MALFHQGDLKAASDQLSQARSHWEQYNSTEVLVGPWNDWLIAHLLLQEAEKLISDPKQTSPR